MFAKKNQITLTVILLLALVALVTGVFFAQHLTHKPIDSSRFHGTLLQKPREMASFSLIGADQKPFGNSQLQDKWTFMFFGFTNCGYVCPTTMAELAKMYRLLEERNIHPMPQVVFVSIDPARDTLVKLGQYSASFNPHFYAARGEEESIKAMTNLLGVAFATVSTPQSENYDIQHSGSIILFNPKGQVSAFFTSPHHADQLADDYQLLVS